MRLSLTFVALFWIGLSLGERAQVTAAEPLSTAILADGKRLPARLAGIDAEWKISLRREESIRVLPAAELIVWGGYQDVERGPQIVLADGSVIVADVLEVAGTEITIGDATGLGRVLWSPSSLPRTAVRALIYQPPADLQVRDKLLDEVVRSPSREDELRLLGGEVIRGTLLAGEAQRLGPNPPGPPLEVFRVAVRGRSEPLQVSAAKVETLVLGDAGRSQPKTDDRQELVTLGLRDGSLVACRGLRISRSSLELHLAAGGVLQTTLEEGSDGTATFWDQVTLVQPQSPHVRYLSDLETIGYKHIPFTGLEWSYGRNRNVLGGRLRSGGVTYWKGLGMHSAARLAYELEGGWRRLESEIALDDAANLEGSVVFKVVLEEAPGQWRAAYESPVVRGGDLPRSIAIDLKQAGRIALLVEFADRGDVHDYANWLNVRLVK